MAMTTGSGSGGGLSSDINVTPMIDVLLVLLIIFMITQPLSRRAFDVQVPAEQQQRQRQQQQSNQIVLELRPDGSYAINNQPVTLAGLDAALHQVFDARPAKLLFVKAAPTPRPPFPIPCRCLPPGWCSDGDRGAARPGCRSWSTAP